MVGRCGMQKAWREGYTWDTVHGRLRSFMTRINPIRRSSMTGRVATQVIMPDEGAWAGKPVTLETKACRRRHRHERQARRQAGRQTASSDQEGAYPGTISTCPGRWFRPHTFRNKLLKLKYIAKWQVPVQVQEQEQVQLQGASPPGSVHCSIAHCPDGEHRPYLISGARAGQLPSELP